MCCLTQMEIRTENHIKKQQFIHLRQKKQKGVAGGGGCRSLFLLAFSCGGCSRCCCVSLQLLLPLLQEDSVLIS